MIDWVGFRGFGLFYFSCKQRHHPRLSFIPNPLFGVANQLNLVSCRHYIIGVVTQAVFLPDGTEIASFNGTVLGIRISGPLVNGTTFLTKLSLFDFL